MALNSLRPSRILFPLLWVMFVVKSLLYIAVTPLWEGFDELFHFAYVHSLAATNSLPVWGEAFVDSDIARSTAYVPLAQLMPQLTPGFEKLSYRDYWMLDEAKRQEFERNLRGLTASANRFEPSDVPLYQIQHPPLYYAMCAPLYLLMNDWSLTSKVHALRFFSALLASLCIIAAALTAKQSGATPAGYAFAGLVALWPCLYVDTARVGNDSLGVAVFSFVFLAMARYGTGRSARRAAALGVLLGIGLLTKAYFLTAIPAIVLFTIWSGFRAGDERKATLADTCLILACAGLVGGWWYLRNYHLYGTFSGLQETIQFPAVGILERIQAIFDVPWMLVLKNLFVTLCWVNGWSFLHLPKAMYLVFVCLFAVAIVGLVRSAYSSGGREANFSPGGRAISAALFLMAFFALGVAYHEVNAYATVRSLGGPGGWYFYALVVPMSLIVSLGIGQAWSRSTRACFIAAFAAVGAVELYGFLMALAPYYTGIAVPSASGWGVDFIEGRMLVFSSQTLSRLGANKPYIFSPTIIGVLTLACCVIQGAACWTIARLASPSSNHHSSATNLAPGSEDK